jgi:hypothetical protein
MALTLKAEQRLSKVKLTEFFEQNRAVWKVAAKEAYEFARRNFPPQSLIRRDDVALGLVLLLDVNEQLKNFLNGRKLTQRYYVTDFADLIVDRIWTELGAAA